MKHQSTERGQALILIALAAIGLFAFAALAIDGSRSFSNKRHAQNAADTAVLSAALKYMRTNGDYALSEAEAKKRVESNGYKEDWPITIVDVDRCDAVLDTFPAGGEMLIPGDMKVDSTGTPLRDATGQLIPIPCEGISGPAKEYIRVKIISEIPTTFGRVLGRQTLRSAVEAVARVQGSTSNSSYPEQAVVALNKTGCGICANGNGGIEVHGSAVFSNSTSASANPKCNGGSGDDWAMHLKTISDPWAEQGFISPGSGCLSPAGGWGTVGGVPSGQWKPGTQIDPDYDIPAPTITCDAAAAPNSAHPSIPGAILVHKGLHNTKVSAPSGTWVFEPGNHCFLDGVNMNANKVTANDVNFRVDAAEFRMKVDDLTCANMLVFINGGTGVTFDGNGNITCTGVTFYAQTGDVKWTGNPDMTLTAPTSGPYQGLLIHLPDDPTPNSSPVKIGGNSNIQLTGSIIAPVSEITLNGTTDSNGFDTQVVGMKILLDGTSNTTIKYNPANQYKPPADPTIQLTK